MKIEPGRASLLKIVISILCLMTGTIRAGEAERDPFGPPPEKTAAELVECIRGHKTIIDVPIVYGLIGGQTGSSETEDKAKNGDVILGGCIVGSRKHWVVCTTCGLRYDDEYNAWVDSYPRYELAPESERNPQCTIETIRLVLSKELQHITLDLAGTKPSFLSCSRWYDPSGIVGERVLVETMLKKTEFLIKFEAWLRSIGAPEKLALDPLKTEFGTLEWKLKSRSFSVTQNASDKGFFVRIEWHKE